jgi:hypothetical protein
MAGYAMILKGLASVAHCLLLREALQRSLEVSCRA